MTIPKIQRRQRGFAVLIVLLILAMMVAFVMANTSSLFRLKREVKNVDKRQQLRWSRLNSTVTNAPTIAPLK
jgi:type II secretory pathway component PulK